ncbi:MAG TPA: hypothetical protein VFO03_03455 [Gaiellaceae bacterium]|nr:hypothetical protein [Gaiellaceae bacterium]
MPELPPSAPPETRTSGQLVAEAMRLYGRRFWRAVALGVPPTLLGVLLALLTASDVHRTARLSAFVVLFALIGSLCFIVANRMASDRPQSGSSWLALVAGLVVFLPLPVLVALFYLPGLVWFAFLGFAVPAVMFESKGLGDAFRRAIELARADYVHALGSLAAVTIVVLISAGVLSYLLIQFGEQAQGAAAFIAILLLSPLLFLAAALLYQDQVARLREH